MGSGKTTVGAALAERLGWRFIDLDTQIEAREQKSVADIFQGGEQAFRRAEADALSALLGALNDGDPTVVALGGGAFAQPQNQELLGKCGAPIIHLDASADELLERCRMAGPERPLFRDESQFRLLYEERRPHYLQATFHLQTTRKSVAEVVRELESLVAELA